MKLPLRLLAYESVTVHVVFARERPQRVIGFDSPAAVEREGNRFGQK
jgi:hypothetical protein